MKINDTIKLTGKNLAIIVLLSQLAACNFLASAAGSVGGVQNANADVYDTVITAGETNNNADEVGSTAINKILSWTAPATREDALPISMVEISGYRVYYGTKQGEYGQYIDIADVYTDEINLNVFNLESGTYYLVVTTTGTSGLESAFSETIVVEV